MKTKYFNLDSVFLIAKNHFKIIVVRFFLKSNAGGCKMKKYFIL